MKKVLIDTHIYSLAMKGDTNVVNTLRKIDRIGFSTISIGELYSGLRAAVMRLRIEKNSIFFWILQEFPFTP